MPNYFIFHSKPDTYNECLERKLFGASVKMGSFINQVRQNDVLFIIQVRSLKDKHNNFIEGPFIAASNGTRDIVREAYSGQFPWQVRIDDSLTRNKIYYSDYKSFFEENKISLFDDLFPPFRMDQNTGNRLLELLGIVLDTSPNQTPDSPLANESDFRKKYRANFLCADGHYVRSLSELTIDNWLYHNNILHSYEKKLPVEETLYSDFYIKKADCYIEFWGINNDPIYLERKRLKKITYKKHGYKLIELEFEHLTHLDDILPAKLLEQGYKNL